MCRLIMFIRPYVLTCEGRKQSGRLHVSMAWHRDFRARRLSRFHFAIFVSRSRVLNASTMFTKTMCNQFIARRRTQFRSCQIFFRTSTLQPFVCIRTVTSTITNSIRVISTNVPRDFANRNISRTTPCTYKRFTFNGSSDTFRNTNGILLRLLTQLITGNSHANSINHSIRVLNSKIRRMRAIHFRLHIHFKYKEVICSHSIEAMTECTNGTIRSVLKLFKTRDHRLNDNARLHRLFSNFGRLFRPRMRFNRNSTIFRSNITRSFCLYLILSTFRIVNKQNSFCRSATFKRYVMSNCINSFTISRRPYPFQRS